MGLRAAINKRSQTAKRFVDFPLIWTLGPTFGFYLGIIGSDRIGLFLPHFVTDKNILGRGWEWDPLIYFWELMEGLLHLVIAEGWQIPPPLPWCFPGSPCPEGSRSLFLGYGECRAWGENTPKTFPASRATSIHHPGPNPKHPSPPGALSASPWCLADPQQIPFLPWNPSASSALPQIQQKSHFPCKDLLSLQTFPPPSSVFTGNFGCYVAAASTGHQRLHGTWKCTPRHLWAQMEVLS